MGGQFLRAIGMRAKRIALGVCGVAAVAVAGSPLAAQQNDRAAREAEQKPVPAARLGVIDGVVTDSLMRPLETADISIVGVDARVVTSESGKFRFLEVPAGQYLVIVRRIGFAPTSSVIDVPADDTLRVSYTLSRAVTMLDTMKVTERVLTWRMLEFEQRRRQGQGQFLTREEIERKHRYDVSDYLRDFRSVQVVRTNTMAFAGTQLYSRRETGSPGQGWSCAIQIILDGIILPRNFNLDLLPPPRDIAGIELYSGPSTVPPQLTANSSCGVLVVWTRDGD